jgi:hypothetical protein
VRRTPLRAQNALERSSIALGLGCRPTHRHRQRLAHRHVAERAIPELFGRGEAAKADRRRGCRWIELRDLEQGRSGLVRKMAQAIVLQPLAEGGVAGVLSAALGKAPRQQETRGCSLATAYRNARHGACQPEGTRYSRAGGSLKAAFNRTVIRMGVVATADVIEGVLGDVLAQPALFHAGNMFELIGQHLAEPDLDALADQRVAQHPIIDVRNFRTDLLARNGSLMQLPVRLSYCTLAFIAPSRSCAMGEPAGYQLSFYVQYCSMLQSSRLNVAPRRFCDLRSSHKRLSQIDSTKLTST